MLKLVEEIAMHKPTVCIIIFVMINVSYTTNLSYRTLYPFVSAMEIIWKWQKLVHSIFDMRLLLYDW